METKRETWWSSWKYRKLERLNIQSKWKRDEFGKKFYVGYVFIEMDEEEWTLEKVNDLFLWPYTNLEEKVQIYIALFIVNIVEKSIT
jgi:hypothetical protein